MTVSAFELGEQIALRKVVYKLHPELWARANFADIDLNFDTWTKIKYLNDAGNDFHADVADIPNNTGGVYLFFVKCPVIVGITEYPFYVGRAQFTDNQNLRKRVREYFTTFARDDERPKITRMIKYWGAELFLAYKTIEGNEGIIDFERNLINSLLLPMNDRIPDQEIQQAVQAFPQ